MCSQVWRSGKYTDHFKDTHFDIVNARSLSWLTRTFNGHVIIYTCAFPALTHQNICHEKGLLEKQCFFLTSVKMGGSGRTGPKGGTSSLAVTDTCGEEKDYYYII